MLYPFAEEISLYLLAMVLLEPLFSGYIKALVADITLARGRFLTLFFWFLPLSILSLLTWAFVKSWLGTFEATLVRHITESGAFLGAAYFIVRILIESPAWLWFASARSAPESCDGQQKSRFKRGILVALVVHAAVLCIVVLPPLTLKSPVPEPVKPKEPFDLPMPTFTRNPDFWMYYVVNGWVCRTRLGSYLPEKLVEVGPQTEEAMFRLWRVEDRVVVCLHTRPQRPGWSRDALLARYIESIKIDELSSGHPPVEDPQSLRLNGPFPPRQYMWNKHTRGCVNYQRNSEASLFVGVQHGMRSNDSTLEMWLKTPLGYEQSYWRSPVGYPYEDFKVGTVCVLPHDEIVGRTESGPIVLSSVRTGRIGRLPGSDVFGVFPSREHLDVLMRDEEEWRQLLEEDREQQKVSPPVVMPRPPLPMGTLHKGTKSVPLPDGHSLAREGDVEIAGD